MSENKWIIDMQKRYLVLFFILVVKGWMGTMTAATFPEAPTNVAVTAIGLQYIQLQWEAVEDAETYSIYRNQDDGDYFVWKGNSSSLSFIDKNLAPGTWYYYIIIAHKDGERSESSERVKAQTLKEEIPTPDYCTVVLQTAPGIEADWKDGKYDMNIGENLELVFRLQDPSVNNKEDILIRINGEEKSFRQTGNLNYFVYRQTDVPAGILHVEISLRTYPVTLPEVEGTVLTPLPGIYRVDYGESFIFSLQIEKGYDPSEMQVLANGTVFPPSPDCMEQGLKTEIQTVYKIPVVYGPVTIEIEGLKPNSSLGTVNPALPCKVWVTEDGLLIDSENKEFLQIYNTQGRLLITRSIMGQSRISLESGLYIVVCGSEVYKMIIP